MKRKSLRTLVCALLASLALTTFAFADNGPKPQLIVRVKNAPALDEKRRHERCDKLQQVAGDG
mgnify:CR=1 FL=1